MGMLIAKADINYPIGDENNETRIKSALRGKGNDGRILDTGRKSQKR